MKTLQKSRRIGSWTIYWVPILFLGFMTQLSYGGEWKIGTISPLTGPGTFWGTTILHGVEIAADDINAKGGLLVKGERYKVVVIPCDDKYSGKGGSDCANRLVFTDGVKYIFGSNASASVLAYQPITTPNKVLTFSDGYSEEILSAEKSYTFQVYGIPLITARDEVPGLLKLFPQVKQIAFIGPNDASGWGTSKGYITELKKHGITILSDDFYERTVKDFYPSLTKILAKNPDLIHTSASAPGTVPLIVKQARELGYKGLFLGIQGALAFPDEFTKAAGGPENADGYMYFNVWDINSEEPKIKEFVAKYQKKYGKLTYVFNPPCFYDAVMVCAKSIENLQTFDTTKIRDAAETIQYDGLSGPWKLRGKEEFGIAHQRETASYLVKVENGKEVIVKKVK